MKIADTVFRFRKWVLFVILVIGFWAPWERLGDAHPGTTWLFLAGLLARIGILPIAYSSIAVMGVAIVLALLAALLRTWGSAYLGSGVVHDSALHADQVVADGPYRYLRNPLYAGTWMHTLALSILMPPGGALFAVIAVAVVNAVKVRAEERHLLAAQGEAYAEYARRVPRYFSSLLPRVPAGGARARWGDGLPGELYFWGVAVTYIAFASRYNVTILEQGVLVSLGVAIVARGVMRPRVSTVE